MMTISFNLRLRYEEALGCKKKIEELGGSGGIVTGGSYFNGTKDQIVKLIDYMGEKDYDFASMSIGEMPEEATQRRVDKLRADGVIK